MQQLCGSLATRIGQRFGLSAPPFDPVAVLLDQGAERHTAGLSVGQRPEHVHRQHGAGHTRSLRLLDVRPWDPRRTQRPAGALHDLPVRGYPVPGGVLGGVGVVEVGYPIVPIGRLYATRVRPRHEGLAATNLDLGLEGVGPVGIVVVRRTPVDQKNRHRPRSCGNPGESVGTDRPLIDVER